MISPPTTGVLPEALSMCSVMSCANLNEYNVMCQVRSYRPARARTHRPQHGKDGHPTDFDIGGSADFDLGGGDDLEPERESETAKLSSTSAGATATYPRSCVASAACHFYIDRSVYKLPGLVHLQPVPFRAKGKFQQLNDIFKRLGNFGSTGTEEYRLVESVLLNGLKTMDEYLAAKRGDPTATGGYNCVPANWRP